MHKTVLVLIPGPFDKSHPHSEFWAPSFEFQLFQVSFLFKPK